MVAHNNVVPNVHFHKNWQERVKTWFDQPGRKKSRRVARARKAARIFPRPIEGALRPIVRGQTNKYNTKQRLGRGFTFEELKEAGIERHFAQTIGIAVDHRRRNRCDESLQQNVQRLKEYKSKLVLFPKNTKKVKAGEANTDECNAAVQQRGVIMPLTKEKFSVTRAPITEDMRKGSAYLTLRIARGEQRSIGKRAYIKKKRAADAEAGGKKKK